MCHAWESSRVAVGYPERYRYSFLVFGVETWKIGKASKRAMVEYIIIHLLFFFLLIFNKYLC